MDLMERRRVMLASGKKVLDTSPIIIQYGVKFPQGDPETVGLVADSSCCITDKYQYEQSNKVQTLVARGITTALIIYNSDGAYIDWWSWWSGTTERRAINTQSAMISCTILIDQLTTAYAYIKDTGQILFAGKNSPYYGYTNINDMP